MTHRIVGIDYSMSCPCSCVFVGGKEFDISNCQFLFLSDTKKYHQTFSNIKGIPVPEFSSNEERYDKISDIFLNVMKSSNVTTFSIEGYAYGGSGVVFHIAENTGLLKHKVYKEGIDINIYPPSRIKKFATGSGRADKSQMYESFLKETGLDLRKLLNYEKTKIESPISDIVDSYYICKYQHSLLCKLK